MNNNRLIGVSALVVALALGSSVVFDPGARAMSPGTEGVTKPTPAAVDALAAIKAAHVQWAQWKLKKLGDYKGKIDGKGGPLTIAAIMKYQKQNGLKPTGWLDQATWDRIGRPPAAAWAPQHATAK
ncbi:MAG TPA: peptidoglycan-binding domain-containing protein [Stellaceae bacterium]|nr:peptidoglycan-binding domain-containing protein [Stellaceae bacterium]